MMNTNQLMSMIDTLPIEIKTQLIERLLKSIHPSEAGAENYWIAEAERRVAEIKSGAVKTIPGDIVFKEIHDRFIK